MVGAALALVVVLLAIAPHRAAAEGLTIWDWLSSLFTNSLNWAGAAIDGATTSIVNSIQGAAGWFSNLFGDLFRNLTSYLSAVVGPIWDLVSGVLYLLTRVIDVVILVVQVLLLLVQVLVATGAGLIRTLTGLAAFDPASVQPAYLTHYQQGASLLFQGWRTTGGAVVAAILTWVVRLAGAIAVVRILSR